MESVDFADPDAAARFADDLISRKPAGIVHAAGIFSDRLLMSQDWRGFEAALGAKIVGGWEAYRVLSACPDAFLIFADHRQGCSILQGSAITRPRTPFWGHWRRMRGQPV